MDDLTQTQRDLEQLQWVQIASLDRALGTLRNALQATGSGSAALAAAEVVADRASALLTAVARADGYTAAVHRM